MISAPISNDAIITQNNQALLIAMKKLEDADEELSALKLQLVTMREMYQKERLQNVQKKQEMDQLSLSFNQRFQEVNSKQPEFESVIEAERETNHSLREENDVLRNSLDEGQQHNKQLERVIQFLRERGEEATLEAQQLREEFQALQHKVTDIAARNEVLDRENEELKQKVIANEQVLEETIQKHTEDLELLNTEVMSLRQVQHQLEESHSAVKENHTEKEQELKLAQQHLGKKMKELAILAEKNEEQHAQLQTLQRELAEAHTKIAVAQQSIELQLQREKHIQEQLQTNTQAVETQIKKWEEKYFQIYDKWQDTEARNRAFKNLEDRHHQAQSILANLSSLISVPSPTSLLKENHQSKIDPERPMPTYPLSHPKEDSKTFFDGPANGVRYKQTLFD